jgi:hypothetical protein
MSTSVTNAFVASFADDVKDAYQREGSFLLQTVRRATGVVGNTHTFFRVGKGMATTKARHGTITPMNVDHTAIEALLEDFYAGDWVDILDLNRITIDERGVLARAGARALGRKSDDQILTKMDADNSNVVGSSTAITRAMFLQASETLDDNDVPRDGRRFGLLTPRQWSIAMTIDEFADADFVGSNLPYLVGALPRTWLGIHWMVHTGLPGKGTATSRNFIYHTDAIGYASGTEITPDITWHGDRAAWFINNMMSGGAAVIDPDGLVEIRTDDTAAIPTS